MNKTIKVISTLVLIVMLGATVNSVVLAVTPGEIQAADMSSTMGGVKTAGSKIFGAIQIVAVVIAVVVLAALGIKYMIGSTEERAGYKKAFIPYIVGVVLVVGAASVANWIWGAASSLSD